MPTSIGPSIPWYQERIVQAGAVPAIIALSAGEGVEVALQRRCAAALCNLACTPANISRMVEVGGKSTVACKRGQSSSRWVYPLAIYCGEVQQLEFRILNRSETTSVGPPLRNSLLGLLSPSHVP